MVLLDISINIDLNFKPFYVIKTKVHKKKISKKKKHNPNLKSACLNRFWFYGIVVQQLKIRCTNNNIH